MNAIRDSLLAAVQNLDRDALLGMLAVALAGGGEGSK